METLLKVVENVAGDCTKAEAAEQAVMEELRNLGNEALQGWAARAVQKATATVRDEQPALQGNGKKKSGGLRFSGKSRSEPVLRGPGPQVRPFLTAAVTARSCSLPLQRAMPDFGADHGFGHGPKKLQEHYGARFRSVPYGRSPNGMGRTCGRSRIGVGAGHHAWLPATDRGTRWLNGADCDEWLEAGDKRKHKTLQWQEGTCLGARSGSVTPKFAATFGRQVEEVARFACVCCGGGVWHEHPSPWCWGWCPVDRGAIRRDVWCAS